MVSKFSFYPDEIPDELKADAAWVCCDEDKVPMVAHIRQRSRWASSTNPNTWRPYEQALAAYSTGRYAGLGRVIEWDGPYCGVDLDGCRDPETGEISREAWKILEHLNSYSEVSPSLEGVKVWVKADIDTSHKKPGLEIYHGRRYFTTTGQILSQFPAAVEERPAEIRSLVAEEFPRPEKKRREAYTGPTTDSTIDLSQVLRDGGVEVLAEGADGTARVKYRVVCPWWEEHTCNAYSGAYAGQYADGALFFTCWHAHCHGRGWTQFRQVVNRRTRLKRRAAEELYYGMRGA